MALRFKITPDGRDPVALMLDEIIAAEKAVSKGTQQTGRGLLRDWRGQVRTALSYRLAGAIRQRSYPDKQASINAASLVYAPSKNKRSRLRGTGMGHSASAAEVIESHDKGSLIRAADGFFLAIPLSKSIQGMGMRGGDLTGKFSRARITPARWERNTGRKLRMVYRKGENSLLVDDGDVLPGNPMVWRGGGRRGGYKSVKKINRKKPIPIFVLVPQVKLRKKLDLDRDAVKWGDQLPALILKNWKV